MGRKVQIRVSYQADAGYLMRLAQAIELDTKRPPEWKRTAIGYINSIAVMFLKDAGVITDSKSK